VHPEVPGLADLAFGGRPPRIASDSGLVDGGRALVPGLPDLGWVGGRRVACLPVGASVAWAWATVVMAARLVAASRAPSTRADASLDLDTGASDRSMGEVGRLVSWPARAGG